MRMVWKTLRFRHVGLAFFWACSMLTFRSSILLQGPANTPELETLRRAGLVHREHDHLVRHRRVHGTRSAYVRPLPRMAVLRLHHGRLVVIDVAGRLGSDATMMALLVGGSVLTGVGYGYYWGSWAEYLGACTPRARRSTCRWRFLLTAALFLIISLSAEYESAPPLLLMLPLPVLSLVCLRRCPCRGSRRALRAHRGLETLPYGARLAGHAHRGQPRAIAAVRARVEMTVLSVGSVNEAHQAPLVANLVVAVCLIGLVLYAHKRLDLALAYRVIVPVIVILFAVLPFFWETSPVVLNA